MDDKLRTIIAANNNLIAKMKELAAEESRRKHENLPRGHDYLFYNRIDEYYRKLRKRKTF